MACAIGLVKLMGRHAGFLTAGATVASQDVNFALIPEMPFALDTFLAALKQRMLGKTHAVIAVAEGAGQDLLAADALARDASGNIVFAFPDRFQEAMFPPSLSTMDFLSYFALGLIIFVILILAYGMIAIHDIPYHIAQKRNHPHQDAIHTAGWVSLFTLHAIWPFLWIWATSYHPEGGYAGRPESKLPTPCDPIDTPDARIALLEARLAEIEKSDKQKNP